MTTRNILLAALFLLLVFPSFAQDFDFTNTIKNSLDKHDANKLSNKTLKPNPNLARDVFETINFARTNPKEFFEKHQEQIKKYKSSFLEVVKSAVPINIMQWDQGFADMSKTVIEYPDSLSPTNRASIKNCGYTYPRGSSTPGQPDPVYYVCRIHSLIYDPDYISFGMHTDAKNSEYVMYVGKTCNPQKFEYKWDGKVDSSGVDFKILNTAANMKAMTDKEKEMVVQINLARYYPKFYANLIRSHMNKISPMDYQDYKAGMSLISQLEEQPQLSILKPLSCLNESAKKQAKDNIKRGYNDHKSSTGTWPNERITADVKPCQAEQKIYAMVTRLQYQQTLVY